MNSDKETLKTKIVDALQTVYDPEIPVSIYELGLIYDIEIKEIKVPIHLPNIIPEKINIGEPNPSNIIQQTEKIK